MYAHARQTHTHRSHLCIFAALCSDLHVLLGVCVSLLYCCVHMGVCDCHSIYTCEFCTSYLGQIPLRTLLGCGTMSKSLALSEAQFFLLQSEATHRSQLGFQGL